MSTRLIKNKNSFSGQVVDHALNLRNILDILSQGLCHYFCKLQKVPLFPQSFLEVRNAYPMSQNLFTFRLLIIFQLQWLSVLFFLNAINVKKKKF